MEGQTSHACSAEKHRLKKAARAKSLWEGGIGSQGPESESPSTEKHHVLRKEQLEESKEVFWIQALNLPSLRYLTHFSSLEGKSSMHP